MARFQPVIKWSGSKRSQTTQILQYFPDEMHIYYEPFCGGASMMRALMESGKKVDKYIISDINKDLIALWQGIQYQPDEVYSVYKRRWEEMKSLEDRADKREYFKKVRDLYNKYHDPFDFMFIMRTTTNGMPRYSKSGNFNNSFHITRDGIEPEKLKKLIDEWSGIINKNDVSFKHCDYLDIKTGDFDFMYLDPPYAGTKGMYYGKIDYNELFDYLRNLNCSYAMSFDGISGDVDNTYDVPEDVYDKHAYIRSGNSSFKRTIGKDKHAIVYESLYIRRNEHFKQKPRKIF